jgi:hypothetical protein
MCLTYPFFKYICHINKKKNSTPKSGLYGIFINDFKWRLTSYKKTNNSTPNSGSHGIFINYFKWRLTSYKNTNNSTPNSGSHGIFINYFKWRLTSYKKQMNDIIELISRWLFLMRTHLNFWSLSTMGSCNNHVIFSFLRQLYLLLLYFVRNNCQCFQKS